MANAAVNILGDGSILDTTTLGGDVTKLQTLRVEPGVYELHGTYGMVPPPYGWGVVTNPVDKLSAQVSYANGVLNLEARNEQGELVDIPSMVTLHIVIEDAPHIAPSPEPQPEPQIDMGTQASAELARRRGMADEVIQQSQDLIDIGEGTPEIEAQILAWKRHRVALCRVGSQAGWPGSVEWPVEPE